MFGFWKWYIKSSALCLATFVSACTQKPEIDYQQLRLDGTPSELVRAGFEYRSAWNFSPGNYVYTLPMTESKANLRVGIRPTLTANPITFTLYRADLPIAQHTAMDDEDWLDIRIPLDSGVANYCLTLESNDDFWISHIEQTGQTEGRPNILLVLIDTLRPDRMSCYGYPRETTPNIDHLAANAVQFTQAVAQSSWTRPSTASLLTSTYPGAHGAEDRPDVIRNGLPSLADSLRKLGYVTVGLANNPNLQPRWGFGRGFDCFVDATQRVDLDFNERDQFIIQSAQDFIGDLHGRSWMLFVHVLGPHGPYSPPAPFDQRFPPNVDGLSQHEQDVEELRSSYDNDIVFTDDLVGRLLNQLKGLGAFDQTLIVLTSDHGEQFFEHGGLGHGQTLFDEELLVPLIVKPQEFDGSPRSLDGVVELVDVAPTILELIGAPEIPGFQGQSLANMFQGGSVSDRFGYASLRLNQRDSHAVRSKSYKYLFDATSQLPTFYDLVSDPAERFPIHDAPPATEALVDHAATRTTADAAGFHLVITDLRESERPISGTVIIDDMEVVEYQNPGGLVRVEHDGDTIMLDGQMRSPKDDGHVGVQRWLHSARLTNYVHIQVDANIGGNVSVNLAFDGPAPLAQAGQDGKAIPLDGTQFPLSSIIAMPSRYTLSVLPEEFAIYAWYIPPVEVIRDNELPTEVLDDLEALGYVG